MSKSATKAEPKDLVCPSCKSSDGLSEKATLIGYCGGEAVIEKNGEREFIPGGYTEIEWDTYKVVHLVCECGGWAGDLDELLEEEGGDEE